MSKSVAYVVRRNLLDKHLLVFNGHNFAAVVMCMVLDEYMITCNYGLLNSTLSTTWSGLKKKKKNYAKR